MKPRRVQDRPPFRLLVVTDRRRVPGDLYARVAQALDDSPAGLAVLLREHDLPLRTRLDLARRLVALCRPAGVPFLVSDRLDLALACGADGVHLGVRSLPVAGVRQTAPQLLVGCSCHSAEELAQAARAGAHYATLSPVFPTNSKPDVTPLGPRTATRLAARAALPVYALGGLDASRLAALRDSAFAGVAVVEGVLAAPAPGVAAHTLSRLTAQTLPNAVSELLGNSETP